MRLLLVLIALVLVFAAVTLWRAARNEAASEAAYPPSGEIIDVDGIQIHAVVKGSGPDLVLIHGASGSARDFTFSLVDKLAADYRVITFDRPGFGYSDRLSPKGETIFAQAGILKKAAAQLGATAPIVVGQSYGGSVALAWATKHPDDLSALVTLAAPALPWDSPLPRLYQLNTHPVWGKFLPHLISAWVTDSRVSNAVAEVFAPQDPPEGYAAHFGPGLTLRRGSLWANAYQRASLLSEVTKMADTYGRIVVPTEIVHGDVDTTVSIEIHSRPLSQIIPEANLTELPGIGHMPHHVAEDAVIEAIHRAATRAALR